MAHSLQYRFVVVADGIGQRVNKGAGAWCVFDEYSDDTSHMRRLLLLCNSFAPSSSYVETSSSAMAARGWPGVSRALLCAESTPKCVAVLANSKISKVSASRLATSTSIANRS